MLRVGFIGAGWRAHGYMRVIKELRHRMEVSGVLVRSAETAQKMEKEFPGKIDMELDKFVERGHDFVMLQVPGKAALYYIEKLAEKGIPVLSETPPGYGVEELNRCYAIKQKYGAKIQVAEQYFLRPYCQAVLNLVKSGRLGKISSIDSGMVHDYHATSMIRKILGITFENACVEAKEYRFPVHYHCGREGLHAEKADNLVIDRRKRGEFVFDTGQVVFYDFSDEQYFNYFRSRHLNVMGDLGEIWDYNVAYLGDDGLPIRGSIIRDELGQFENLEKFCLRSLLYNGEVIYTNPYKEEDVRLSDDEIAMAGILDGMQRYIQGGEEIYPLEEALQDTYLHLSLDEAIRQGKTVQTQNQSWVK